MVWLVKYAMSQKKWNISTLGGKWLVSTEYVWLSSLHGHWRHFNFKQPCVTNMADDRPRQGY